MERDATVRLFLALRLPDVVRDGLAEWGAERLRSGRRVARDDLHVTLAFLGATRQRDIPGVCAALRAAAAVAAPIELAIERWRETRSVGMLGLADERGAAAAVASDVQERLELLGWYRREARPWLAHVTVLRFRDAPGLDPPLPAMGTFVPSDAAAYLSSLQPSGARYRILDTTPLGGSTR